MLSIDSLIVTYKYCSNNTQVKFSIPLLHVLLLVFLHTVPTPTVTISPLGPIQGAMVGSPQVFTCTVSTVSGVESSSVMISWMGPGGIITNDSRVTISPTTSSGNDFLSTLQLDFLMERDNGTYTCNVMISQTNGSQSVELESLTSKFFQLFVDLCT